MEIIQQEFLANGAADAMGMRTHDESRVRTIGGIGIVFLVDINRLVYKREWSVC